MKNLLKKFLVNGLAAILLAIASTGIASACGGGFYQPELPEE
ncbi:cyclic lactone autoinducer peptide [Orenia metallireducens]|nr:cyclic lactone autoinducer peptide [Orenia metallireducens]